MNDNTDEKPKEYFINTANWLVKHAKEKETNDIDYSLWTYNFPWPFYTTQHKFANQPSTDTLPHPG